jgi:hypothetical protein
MPESLCLFVCNGLCNVCLVDMCELNYMSCLLHMLAWLACKALASRLRLLGAFTLQGLVVRCLAFGSLEQGLGISRVWE